MLVKETEIFSHYRYIRQGRDLPLPISDAEAAANLVLVECSGNGRRSLCLLHQHPPIPTSPRILLVVLQNAISTNDMLQYEIYDPLIRPLATTHGGKFGKTYEAHSDGFSVASGDGFVDNLDSIQQLAKASVTAIGRVSILSLSFLDRWLAASVDQRIHFSFLDRWYDASNIGCVRHIDSPSDDPDKCIESVHYGLSPQGNLMCALSSFSDIDIWRLDDDDEWKKLHSLNYEFFNERFVSFVPGRFDSNFLLRDFVNHLYVYNLHTHEYESCPPGDALHGLRLTTLTMVDLGVWPSSPFSNTAETSNIHSVKQLLTWCTG